MPEVRAYLSQVELALVSSPLILVYDIVRQFANTDDGYIRVRAVLFNDDFLEAAEYFAVEQGLIVTVDYHYQWMSPKQDVLLRRWDSAPHHPELTGFPYHVHTGDENTVSAAGPLSIIELLRYLEDELLNPSLPGA